MTWRKKGDPIAEVFTQTAIDGQPEMKIHRVHGIDGHGDMTRQNFEHYQAELSARQSLGRYTLEEAAMLIAQQESGADVVRLLKDLKQAVRDRSLPVYGPNAVASYKNETVREFFEEAYWDDLNKWLEANEKRLCEKWQFPKPSHVTAEGGQTGLGDGKKTWWQTEYDILEMAQVEGEKLMAHGDEPYLNAVARKVSDRINVKEGRKTPIGEKPRSISVTPLKKGPLKGWKYSPE